MKVTRRRPGERASFTWQDYRDFLVAVHHQLHAPMIVVWDNLNVHKAEGLREFIAANSDWLTGVPPARVPPRHEPPWRASGRS